jgi:hypothetical protein
MKTTPRVAGSQATMRSELLTEMHLMEILLPSREDDRSRPRSIRGCATITEQYSGVIASPARRKKARPKPAAARIITNHRLRGHDGQDRSPLVEEIQGKTARTLTFDQDEIVVRATAFERL